MAFRVTRVDGSRRSTRLAVAFLEADEQDDINAKRVFDQIALTQQKVERDIRNRFDHWIDGEHKKEWHHGWDVDEFDHCYTFKYKLKGIDQRLYGFLINPCPSGSPWFRVCVLAFHTKKVQFNTEKKYLRRLNELRADDAVMKAIAQEFRDSV